MILSSTLYIVCTVLLDVFIFTHLCEFGCHNIAVHCENPPSSYFWQVQNVNLLVNIHSISVQLGQSEQSDRCRGTDLPGGSSVQSKGDFTVW